MTQDYIREYPSGKILGIIETYENGDQIARDYNTRRLLGYYKADLNRTEDELHRTIATGNCVASLIYSYNR
ncbi:MAG: hypothetical protein J1G38_02060 [Clostridiales bacterium]|nr:hypothetical protein [Clostridiales bacterium]